MQTPANSELQPLSLWLHGAHGRTVSAVQPLEVPCADKLSSMGKTFADHASQVLLSTSEENRCHGLSCHLSGKAICVEDASGLIKIPLFLTEVAWTTFQNMVLIVLTPPAEGTKLKELAEISNGPLARGDSSWFLLSPDISTAMSILDALSVRGCLRDDLTDVYHEAQQGPHMIGQGGYAKVYCMRHQSGSLTAVKKMYTTVELDAIEREVKMLIDAKGHENIVVFQGLYREWEKDTIRLTLCTEMAPHGDLLGEVLNVGLYIETDAKPLFQGLMTALAYIHGLGMLHRDIKAENLLLRHRTFPMLADFGLATKITDEVQMARRCGSPGYVAPEACLGLPYGPKLDCFGAGVVLYFILSKGMPFTTVGDDTAATLRKTVKCSLHLRAPPFNTISSKLKHLLRGLICRESEQRLCSTAASEHPWFEDSPSVQMPAAFSTGLQHESVSHHAVARPPPPALQAHTRRVDPTPSTGGVDAEIFVPCGSSSHMPFHAESPDGPDCHLVDDPSCIKGRDCCAPPRGKSNPNVDQPYPGNHGVYAPEEMNLKGDPGRSRGRFRGSDVFGLPGGSGAYAAPEGFRNGDTGGFQRQCSAGSNASYAQEGDPGRFRPGPDFYQSQPGARGQPFQGGNGDTGGFQRQCSELSNASYAQEGDPGWFRPGPDFYHSQPGDSVCNGSMMQGNLRGNFASFREGGYGDSGAGYTQPNCGNEDPCRGLQAALAARNGWIPERMPQEQQQQDGLPPQLQGLPAQLQGLPPHLVAELMLQCGWTRPDFADSSGGRVDGRHIGGFGPPGPRFTGPGGNPGGYNSFDQGQNSGMDQCFAGQCNRMAGRGTHQQDFSGRVPQEGFGQDGGFGAPGPGNYKWTPGFQA